MFYTNVRSPVKRAPVAASSRSPSRTATSDPSTRLPQKVLRACSTAPDPRADPTTGIGDTRSVARRIVIGVMVCAGLAIAVAWGLKSAIAYFSLLAIVVVLVWGA